jgi:NADH-ubiquinone oxidoreductase chain 5
MYLLIIILPLLGSIISGFFGRKVGIKGGQLITSCFILITTLLACFAFIEVGFNNISLEINLMR